MKDGNSCWKRATSLYIKAGYTEAILSLSENIQGLANREETDIPDYSPQCFAPSMARSAGNPVSAKSVLRIALLIPPAVLSIHRTRT